MMELKNRTTLVTGASSGIGECFARELASRGSDLVLVARSENKLRALAATLSKSHGVRAEVIAADLTQRGAAESIRERCAQMGIDVHLLVNNAGFATHGRFEELAIERQREEVTLNCLALMETTHAFLPGMLARGAGGIIHVASTAAFQPVPYMATYGATKAFVLSFSEALWAENRDRGVRVLALCPGATETAFFDVVGAEEASVGARESPEVVVRRALRALSEGRSYVISGAKNYWMAQSSRLLPRATVAATTARIMRPRAPTVGAAAHRRRLSS